MAVSNLPPIPILAGPTGGGKSALAHELAREYGAEIIVADSRQVYTHLDLGTEKPTSKEQSEVPYHLIDRVLPGESYSAFRFREEAETAVRAISARGNIPFVVGGTGFYIRALTKGLHSLPADTEMRVQLEEELTLRGRASLMAELRSVDPEVETYLHPSHTQRLLRCLEVVRLTGKTPRQIGVATPVADTPFLFETILLVPERQELYRRINNRTKMQLASGMLEEVQCLKESGWEEQMRRSRIICYSELLDVLSGKMTLEAAAALIQQNCRNLAKRQITWFRREKEALWCLGSREAEKALRVALSRWKTAA